MLFMLGIVCALKAEASVLIEGLHLKSFPQKTLFPVYHSPEIFLVISGIGKVRSAAATAYLFNFLHERPSSSWLNIGLAGHPHENVGEMRFGCQIRDVASNEIFYPIFPWKMKPLFSPIWTVEMPEAIYNENVLYEMEASAFWKTASILSSAEHIHCIKVVSDNKHLPFEKNPQRCRELIANHFHEIFSFIQKLIQSSKELSDSQEVFMNPFLEKWHFTVSEKHLLKRLLQRWESMHQTLSIWDGQLHKCQKAKEVLILLESLIEGA